LQTFGEFGFQLQLGFTALRLADQVAELFADGSVAFLGHSVFDKRFHVIGKGNVHRGHNGTPERTVPSLAKFANTFWPEASSPSRKLSRSKCSCKVGEREKKRITFVVFITGTSAVVV
jgi:hypothetical protein